MLEFQTLAQHCPNGASHPTEDTVGLIVWSGAEIAVTMICIGIPVCRPLYKRFLDKLTSRDSSGYKKQGDSLQTPAPSYGLRTFGGSPMPNRSGWNSAKDGKSQGSVTDNDAADFQSVKLGIDGPFTEARAVGGRSVPDNNSDEDILGDEYRQGHQRHGRISRLNISVPTRLHTEAKRKKRLLRPE